MAPKPDVVVSADTVASIADPIVCDYCDQPATRIDNTTPLCLPCARDHYGADWRAETLKLGARSRAMLRKLETPQCRWFALCDRPPTGSMPHPILGDVPICDRCKSKAESHRNAGGSAVKTDNGTDLTPGLAVSAGVDQDDDDPAPPGERAMYGRVTHVTDGLGYAVEWDDQRGEPIAYRPGWSKGMRALLTADGHPITDGMRVWDYNLDPGTVNLSRLDGAGWFDVDTDEGGRSYMNAERVCVAHPHTRKPPPVLRAECDSDDEGYCTGACITRPHRWSASGARCTRSGCNVAGTGDPCNDGNCEGER